MFKVKKSHLLVTLILLLCNLISSFAISQDKPVYFPVEVRARFDEIRDCHKENPGSNWKDCRWGCSELCSDIPEAFAHGVCSGLIGQLCCKQYPKGKDSHRCSSNLIKKSSDESEKYTPRYINSRLPALRKCYAFSPSNTWRECKYSCIEICNEIQEDYFRGVCYGTLIELCCDSHPNGKDSHKCKSIAERSLNSD